VRTLLAAGRIGSVVDTPLKLRLLSIHLPAAQHVSYSGPNAMLYALSGGVGADFDGNTQLVTEGAGAFVPASKAATFSASGSDSAHLLLFVLSPAAEAQKPLIGTPAAVEELYRSAEPLPDLQAGPYEFSLTRVSLPPGMPANPPHYRSGAALYYLIAGSGRFTAESKTEPRTARMAHFEPHGLVHSWANPGDSPLVLLQANISQEGIPAVIPATAK
jgi:quercetin dioxygenase-like cupin family protein